MKNKTNTQKKVVHHEVTEYFLISQEILVSELAALLPDYQEKIEIWTELDLMEVTLTNDALVFEEAAEDFESQEDRAYFSEHNIQKVYAMTYDVLDAEEVKQILTTLQYTVVGRICKEDEIL